MSRIRVTASILGASGYTGGELLRLAARASRMSTCGR